MKKLILTCIFVFVSYLSYGVAASSTEIERQEITGEKATSLILQGKDLSNVVVNGNIDLKRRNIQHPIVVFNSVVNGNFGTGCHVQEETTHITSSVRIERTTVNGSLCLEKTIFHKGFEFIDSPINGYSSFSNSSFNDYFHSTNNRYAVSAIFRNVLFKREAVFDGSYFANGADFQGTTFSSFASFHISIFKKDAIFYNSVFMGDSVFNGCEFAGIVVLTDATFNKEAQFAYSTQSQTHFIPTIFKSDVRLDGIKAFGGVRFDKAIFNGKIILSDADIQGVVSFMGSGINGEMQLHNSSFNDISFRDAMIKNVLDISGAYFRRRLIVDGAKYQQIDVSNSSIAPELIEINWKDTDNKIVSKVTIDDPRRMKYVLESEQVRLQYLKLSEILKQKGQKENADRAYYKSKIIERHLMKNPGKRLLSCIQDIVWGYGTKPLNAIKSGVFIIMMSTFLYLPKGAISCQHSDRDSCWKRFCSAFYFSVNTFTTVGTGDYYPNGWRRGVSMVEGFIGYIVMALFLVSLTMSLQ